MLESGKKSEEIQNPARGIEIGGHRGKIKSRHGAYFCWDDFSLGERPLCFSSMRFYARVTIPLNVCFLNLCSITTKSTTWVEKECLLSVFFYTNMMIALKHDPDVWMTFVCEGESSFGEKGSFLHEKSLHGWAAFKCLICQNQLRDLVSGLWGHPLNMKL